jgi:hypothetical protein
MIISLFALMECTEAATPNAGVPTEVNPLQLEVHSIDEDMDPPGVQFHNNP